MVNDELTYFNLLFKSDVFAPTLEVLNCTL